MKDILLEARDLKVSFKSDYGVSRAVDGVSFQIERGKVLGVVGESGSGKSVTSLSVMRLVPKPNGYIEGGSILFQGQDLLQCSEAEMRKIRGNKIAMIFQEPMSSLNPVFKIGYQLGEALRLHQNIKGPENRRRCEEMLELVRVADPHKMLDRYPHELSGGMRQRVMIAMAMICNPELLIADEPTTALDVTIEAQILRLMKHLQQAYGSSILMITHNLGVVAKICDQVNVMYLGQIVESCSTADLFRSSAHPYTRGLIASVPRIDPGGRQTLSGIQGTVPALTEIPEGCRFSTRCPYADERCRREAPALVTLKEGHQVRCFYPREGAST